MVRTKTMFRYFTIADYKDEEMFLTNQHALGWKLLRITIPGFYTFEKCEKEDYIYQLDFPDIQKGSKRDYIKMFEDCGWEYIFDFVQFSYFRTKRDSYVEQSIFTDDASKIDMIDKIFKRRMLPIMILFFSVFIPNMINIINFNNGFRSVLSIIFMIIMLLYVVLITHCGLKLNQLKREVESK